MKLLIAFLFPIFIHAQTQPMKGANVIKVNGISFQDVCKHLLDEGYFFDQLDSNYKTIITKPKNIKGGNSIVLNIRVKDSVAIISGSLDTHAEVILMGVKEGNHAYDIRNGGMGGSPLKRSFEAMDEFAKSYGLPLTYEKH